jgi:hypothetical protein
MVFLFSTVRAGSLAGKQRKKKAGQGPAFLVHVLPPAHRGEARAQAHMRAWFACYPLTVT